MIERPIEDLSKYSLLSDTQIMLHIENGDVVIDPFVPENLGTNSYDVSLGEFYYREHKPPQGGRSVYSPWSEKDVRHVWGEPQRAGLASKYFSLLGLEVPDGISPDEKVILIRPHETILAHTQEFIGGRDISTSIMQARSSAGRNFLEVCKCAGWGDVGYINRWTMEITNNSQHYIIPLPVGRRIAQIAFFEVGETLGEDYSKKGKYQTSDNLEELKRTWNPEMMIPKMWNDREIRAKK